MRPEETGGCIHSAVGLTAARDYLAAASQLNAMIALRLSRLDDLRDQATRITRVLGAIPGSGMDDRMAELTAEIADQEAMVTRDYHSLLKRQKAIGDTIHRVPDDRQRMILEMRYLQGLPFFRIAMKLHYDERTIYRLHEKALRHVAAQIAMGEAICISTDD